ncbi:MAG: hypothetical protein DWQ31_16855 [Planctomycetota bacterium]|nr:MAG: hypothetical protein DWQ31_16855 [Planctomycetota bacterium]REJ92024.1 MAG: hypothetical protein DWQ35_12805 [Planctomycetota bacterium]REK28560.1 MAG: hypothetical protein DWQ42_04395 [Planctomycetota bacterium]REK39175.1 MAG: hypothetical protein DWQ46_17980 [Planctomycetota bacterium]
MKKKKVQQIKSDLCKPDATQPAVAKKHRISRSTISDIATGRTHKDVPWPEGGPPVKRAGGQRKPNVDYDPTNGRILELEAEIAHLRDERNRERQKAQAGAKQRGLFKAMTDVLTDRIIPIKPLPPVRRPRRKGQIEEHCVMHLSDGHHDQVVVPDECGGLETYNFPISCCRGERYVETVVEWTQQTLHPQFRFTDLWVLAYGDHTSGEIHGHTERSYFRNQFKNCFAIGKLHALMYRDLAPHFRSMHVVYVPGNHGRRTAKKDHHGAHDNWDYLVGKIAELYCGDIGNIDFLIPDAFSVNLDINGVGFHVFHGDDVRGSLGIPYYGLQRRQRNLTALAHAQDGPRIRYFCCGHFHKPGVVGDMDGELIVNGPWVASDAYAFNSFAGYSEPSQWIHGVNPKHGVTWRMNVNLRSDREQCGPNRYKLEFNPDVNIKGTRTGRAPGKKRNASSAPA